MTDDPEFFWFGCALTIVCISVLFSLVSPGIRPLSSGISLQRPDSTIAAPIAASLPTHADRADASIAALQQQCARLRAELQQQQTQLYTDFQDDSFTQLKPLLTQYPTACKMAQTTPDLPASHLTALFTPLETLLQTWQIAPIGTAWEQVPFNTQYHQPDTDDIATGEPVYIRFIGYAHSDRILCPARVSRTLPGGMRDEG